MKTFKRQFIEKWISINTLALDESYMDLLERELLEAVEKDESIKGSKDIAEGKYIHGVTDNKSPKRYSDEQVDSFAISFSAWLLYDPIAIGLRESGMKAGKLLDTYKDRPYINTDTSKQ